ncbi:hypothetical protein LY76DRAFT_142707 [Colletotrichum caudatum]|nr:hypothetical protein LY76DRAFT_142707 [Colletotrichum caudatum]
MLSMLCQLIDRRCFSFRGDYYIGRPTVTWQTDTLFPIMLTNNTIESYPEPHRKRASSVGTLVLTNDKSKTKKDVQHRAFAGAYLWESGRDPEFSGGYGRM